MFAYWSGASYASSSAVATNIATVVNANSTVSAVLTAAANMPASGDVTFTAKVAGVIGNGYKVTTSSFSAFSPASTNLSGGSAGVQPNAFPAKFSFTTASASCADFVVYPTGATGGSNAANIIAYSNLYAGDCTTGTVPSISWAYNTGGTVTTSPILSADGSQVAFMQVSGTTASLVLLKWAASGGFISRTHNAYRTAISLRLPELRSSVLLRSEPGRERYALSAVLRLHPRCALRWRRQRQPPPVFRGF